MPSSQETESTLAVFDYHTVVVGPSGTSVFAPATVTARAGDIVTFDIVDPIHTVTQSRGVDPCVQSGFSSNLGDRTFDVTVNNTEPIYIFCAPHCTSGMVMIINPESDIDISYLILDAKGLLPPITPITHTFSSPSSSTTSTSPGSVTASPPVNSTSGSTSLSISKTNSSTQVNTNSPVSTGSVTASSAALPNTVSPVIPGSSHRNIILGGVLGASTLLACALAIALVIRRRMRKRAIVLGQPRALWPPSAGVPVRERNPLKEKGQTAEASSDARIHETGQGEAGTDSRLRAALEALAALQTEVQELRQADIAETLPEYVSRVGDGRSRIE